MFKRILVGISLFCVASFSNAAFVTQNFTITEKKTDFVETLLFDLFDDNGGSRELISVQFSLMAQTNGVAKAENLSNRVTTVTATLNTEIALVDAMNNVVATSSPSLVRNAELQAFDGIDDFSGVSGINFTDFNTNVMTSGTVSEASDLLAFIGMGSGSIVFSAEALSMVSSNGNFKSEVSTTASGTASIIFEYEELNTAEVPAPAHFALLGIGLLGMCSLRKLRK